MNIEEGNKSIAVFLGYKEGFPHYMDEYGYIQCIEGFDIPDKTNNNYHVDDRDEHQFSINQLEFHSSWDWLIPVLEKIESLGYDICLESRKNMRHRCVIFKSPLLIDKGDASTPWIDSVWKAVVEFIEWYNKQTDDKRKS